MRIPSEMPDILSDSGDSAPGESGRDDASRREKRRLWRIGLLPWALLLAAISVLLTVHFTRHAMPLVTAETLAQARSHWKASDVRNYELRLETQATGLGVSRAHVIVRDGKVTELEVGGETAESHQPSLYTVEGLFEIIQMELQESKPSTGESIQEQRPRSIVRAQFDPRIGIPMHFLRLAPGSNRSVEWNVVKFTPLEKLGAASSPSSQEARIRALFLGTREP